MKKILLITEDFPLGNAERGFLEAEYDALQEKTDVSILALTDIENTLSDKQVYTAPWIRPAPQKLWNQLRRQEVRDDICRAKTGCTPLLQLKRAARICMFSASAEQLEGVLESIICEEKIDVVYTYWCVPATVAAVRLKDRYGIKVVSRFHGYDLYQFREKYGWQPLKKYISENADLLVFACQKALGYYQTAFGCYEEKSIVSYLGTMDYPLIPVQCSGTLKVISCSNVIPLKRVDMIAKCICLASKQIPIEWHHIGGPKTEFDFSQGSNVRYVAHGAVPHDQVIELFRQLCPDVFITLSSSEGLAITVQESLSMGIPVITTDVGGVAEIVQTGYNGYVTPVDITEQEVADILVAFSKLPEKERTRYSQNARSAWERKCNAVSNAKIFVNELVFL